MARKKKIMTPPPKEDAPRRPPEQPLPPPKEDAPPPPSEQLLLLPPSPPPQEDAATPPRPPPLPILAVSPVKNLLKDVTAVTSQIMDILKETPVEAEGETAETDQEPEGQIPVENQGPESEKLTKEPALKEPEILFEKKLEYGDVQPGLDRLVFKRCSAKLKAALEITPSIKVSIVGQNNKVEHTPMLFKRYVVEDLYTLCRDWRRVMTKHALKIGDSVAGFGNDVGRGEFRVKFYIRRDEKKEPGRKTLLLLGKEPKTVVGRVVINCTSKEVGELVVAGQGKMEGYDSGGGDFARFSAKGANGVKYEWSEEVDDDRLSKSVNGAEVGDGEVQMRIDVYKGLRH